MKSFLLFVIFVSGAITINGQEIAQKQEAEIRNELFYSNFDAEGSSLYYDKIKRIENKTPLLEAYEGAAIALLAHHDWNPFNKISRIKASNHTLARAIEKDSKNIEIRFLRFYIQNSTPKYLGYSRNLEEDKRAIIENIFTMDINSLGKDIISYIVNYMTTSGNCSEQEIQLIKNLASAH